MEPFLSGRSAPTGKCPPAGLQPIKEFRPMFPSSESVSREKAAADAHSESSAQPIVELVSGENGIQRIIVTCGCGKRIELDCRYD
jgi:hypothetical protein